MSHYNNGAQYPASDAVQTDREQPGMQDQYYPEEDEEDDVSCAKCQKKPEDVLILTCDHNLCLECAALNLQD